MQKESFIISVNTINQTLSGEVNIYVAWVQFMTSRIHTRFVKSTEASEKREKQPECNMAFGSLRFPEGNESFRREGTIKKCAREERL